MSSKIIFFDIDGTILSHRNYKILDSTKEAIRKARLGGNLTFINTGRTLAEITDEIKGLSFDGFICGCGTYISYRDSILYHTNIEPQLCRMIIEDLRKYQFEAVLESSKAIYYNSESTDAKLVKQQEVQKSKYHLNVLTWDEPEPIFDKFCIWAPEPEAIDQFKEKYKDIFDFLYREENMYEVIPKGYSKATGIQYLLSHLNISHDNTYALGDSSNDFDMLNYVKHSIGMGNSEDQILKVVSFITKDVDQDGVAHALRHFSLI